MWKHNSGNLVGSFDGFKPSEYMKAIDKSGVVDKLDLAAINLAPVLEDIDKSLVKNFPDIGKRNEIVVLTREALAQGGLQKVRELIAQGVLPALVLGLLVPALVESERSQRQPGARNGDI